jgi:hypothetical protein
MTTAAIARLLDSYLTDLEGQPGFWRGLREEVPVYVFSDDSHDRMRVMAPVGELRELEPRVLQVLLQANYDRALDARYALRDREVWSVAVHPLATLAPDDFAGLIEQVVRLVKNTGSTYASTELVFMAPGSESDDGPDSGTDGGGGGGKADRDDDAPGPQGPGGEARS